MRAIPFELAFLLLIASVLTPGCGSGSGGRVEKKVSAGSSQTPDGPQAASRPKVAKQNVSLVVSLKDLPAPEQIVDLGNKVLNYQADPLVVTAGSRHGLKVELVEPGGRRVDITDSEHLNVFTTFYKVHECGDLELCVWPRSDSETTQSSARYGRATVEVEYVSPDGLVGLNGFILEVQPKQDE